MKTIGQNEIRRMTLPFEVKAVKESSDSDHAGTIEGYAAGIHNIDRAGDMILPGAFADTLADFLRDGVICWQHDWMTPIGVPTEAREDAYGLYSKARISNTTQGRDCMTLIKDGVVKKLSIGYRVQDYDWVDRAGLIQYLNTSGLTEQRKQAILQQYDESELSELFLLKKIKLYEYSPVTIPANPNASITAAKGLPFADHSEAVLTAVRELSERVKSIHALRQSQGKKANSQHIEQCNQLAQDFQAMSGDLKAIAEAMSNDLEVIAETTAEGGAGGDALQEDVKRLFAEFQLLEARRLCAA